MGLPMKKAMLSLFVVMIAPFTQSLEIKLKLPEVLPKHNINFLSQVGYEELLPTLSFAHTLINPHTFPQKSFAQNKCLTTFALITAAKCCAAKFAGKGLDLATDKTIILKSNNSITIQ